MSSFFLYFSEDLSFFYLKIYNSEVYNRKFAVTLCASQFSSSPPIFLSFSIINNEAMDMFVHLLHAWQKGREKHAALMGLEAQKVWVFGGQLSHDWPHSLDPTFHICKVVMSTAF